MNDNASQLMEKLNQEYEDYTNQLLEKDAKEIFNHSAETTIKTETIAFLQNSDFLAFRSEEWINAMAEKEDILSEIEETFSYGDYQMNFTKLPEAIKKTGDDLMQEQQKKRSETERA